MSTSVHSYSIAWSDRLIRRVETLLRDVHFAVGELYDKNGYDRRVPLKVLKSAGQKSAAPTHAEEEAPTIDAISPAGSFMLRTTVHRTPFEEDHVDTGIGADIVLTMPDQVCSEEDLREGRYLSRREDFVKLVQAHLKRVQEAATRQVQQRNTEKDKPAEEDEDEDVAGDEEQEGMKKKKSSAAGGNATAERLSRMEVSMLPIHSCYGCHEKKILRIRFRRRTPKHASAPVADRAGTSSPMYYESPYIDVHFRPSMHSGRVSGTKATRKHPLYSYLVLEDYMMPSYLQKLHQLCVDSPGLRRAIVLLKCWALHMGLHAPSSGHSEGLNGFILSAMVLYLMEEGVVNPGMNEETAARAVLVHISNGTFTRPCPQSGMPVMEEKGVAAVMRFPGESLNILFRSSASFFKLVVEKAAQEALQYPKLAELFVQTPFQPLPLRHDVALSIHNCAPPAVTRDLEKEGRCRKSDPGHDESEDEEADNNNNTRKSTAGTSSSSSSSIDLLPRASAYFSPMVEWSHQVRELAITALQSRATDVTVWSTDASTLQLTVLLTSEADGRRRLTRGPAVEDTEAVEAFNAFWGADITSTRQFADGAIYRCVLWNFPENLATTTATQQVLTYALRKHVQHNASSKSSAPLEVSVLLGGLEGFLCERIGGEWKDAGTYTQKPLWEATKDVQTMIAKLPKSAVPCKVTSFDIIAATERLTEVFPVRPHLALTFTTDINPAASASVDAAAATRFNGICTKPSIEPIHCVMTIDDRRRIPDDLEAIQLMKAAIGAQLSKALNAAFGKAEKKNEDDENGAQTAGQFCIFSSCHPHGVDIAYHGYLFRLYIAHYREVSLLRALQMNPRADMLEQKLFWSVQHAKLLRSIAFGHQTFPTAVRLAKRWLSAMCLYEFIVPEVVELLVAHAYLKAHESSVTTLTSIHNPNHSTNFSNGVSAPKTAAGGFIRFIELLATHDWSTPLVLPTTDDAAALNGTAADAEAAKLLRLQQKQQNPQQAMFIATPYAPTDSPFTKATPRQMVLHRLVALAKGAHSVLLRHLRYSLSDERKNRSKQDTMTEALLFRTNLSVFDVALPLNPKTILHPDRSIQPVFLASNPNSTSGNAMETHAEEGSAASQQVSMLAPHIPGTVERVWQLDELEPKERVQYLAQRIERDPVGQAVRSIRSALRDRAMVFYDALAPSELYVVALTETPPSARVCWELAKDVCEAGMGAVLPTPVRLSCSNHVETLEPHKGEQGRSRTTTLGRQPPKQKQSSQRGDKNTKDGAKKNESSSPKAEVSKGKRTREGGDGEVAAQKKKRQKVSKS